MGKRKDMKYWNIPVPNPLNKQLEDYIQKDSFTTKSEFIRTAVRDRLEKENQKLEKVESQQDV